jgi:hypothetical protein
MRSVILFFITLSARLIVSATIDPRFEVAGAAVLIDRSSEIIIAVGTHLQGRENCRPDGESCG